MVWPGAPPCLSVFVVKFANVLKCPVLSGLLNAIPVITINPMYQQDLQYFPSCGRPDIPDISPKPVTFLFFASSSRSSRLAVSLVSPKAPSSVFKRDAGAPIGLNAIALIFREISG